MSRCFTRCFTRYQQGVNTSTTTVKVSTLDGLIQQTVDCPVESIWNLTLKQALCTCVCVCYTPVGIIPPVNQHLLVFAHDRTQPLLWKNQSYFHFLSEEISCSNHTALTLSHGDELIGSSQPTFTVKAVIKAESVHCLLTRPKSQHNTIVSGHRDRTVYWNPLSMFNALLL